MDPGTAQPPVPAAGPPRQSSVVVHAPPAAFDRLIGLSLNANDPYMSLKWLDRGPTKDIAGSLVTNSCTATLLMLCVLPCCRLLDVPQTPVVLMMMMMMMTKC